MSRPRFTDARRLLENLVSRAEKAPGFARLLADVDDKAFGSVAQEDAFVASLEEIEWTGAVELIRRRSDGLIRLRTVRLVDVSAAYRWLGRSSASDVAASALASLRSAEAKDEGHDALLTEVHASWARGVRSFGLRPGQADALRKVLSLADALYQRALSPELRQIDIRTFSREATGDSKALKDNLGAVVAVLRRLHPEVGGDVVADPGDLVEMLGVVAMPHPLLISGRVALDGVPLPRLDFLGLPPEEAGRVTFEGEPAYVLTVENQASFVRHAREINADGRGMVLYTGGFPSRAILEAVVTFAQRTTAPAYHWGDMDVGGVRIFLHLEAALQRVDVRLTPHLMDVARLRAEGTTSSATTARRLLVPSDSAISDLAHWVVAPHRLTLEQEAIAPLAPPILLSTTNT